MSRKGGQTAAFKARVLAQPFERFSWDLWGYLRLNNDRNQLDSERWTNQIQVRMENELAFVVDPLKLEVDRLNKELDKKTEQLKTRTKTLRAARIELATLRKIQAAAEATAWRECMDREVVE